MDEISITMDEVKSILKNNLNTLRNKIDSVLFIREQYYKMVILL